MTINKVEEIRVCENSTSKHNLELSFAELILLQQSDFYWKKALISLDPGQNIEWTL